MNPYFQQQQLPAPPMQPQQYAQQNFPAMQQTAFGQQPYRIPNPYQAAAGWTPQPYVMPGYQYPFPVGQMPVSVPVQQQPTSQGTSTTTSSGAPPLPTSNPPPEPAPLPPPPDTVPFKPAPPPPDEGPSNESMSTASVGADNSKSIEQPSLKSNDEQKPSVNYRTALNSLAVSQQSVSSDEDLETLRSQQKELENQMKKYQSEYEKWFKEFTLWKKQHESHPDQRKYIEYQQKYQKLIEQQQQALKQQYAELQNRIRKKKDTDLGTGDIKPYPVSNVEIGQRVNFPQNPSISQSAPRSNVTMASEISNSDREYRVAVTSQSTYAFHHQPQVSPIQQPKEKFDFQSHLNSSSRPYQEQQDMPLWQKQEKQELYQGSTVPTRNLDSTSGGHYQKHVPQQSGMLQYQGVPSSQGGMRHQAPTLHQSQPQFSSASVYHDQSLPHRGAPHPGSMNQQQSSLNQTPSGQPHSLPHKRPLNTQVHLQTQDFSRKMNQDYPHTLSHGAPVNTQTHLQSQGLADKRNQDYLHTLSHRAPVSSQSHFQAQGIPEKKNQDHPHSLSYRAPVNAQKAQGHFQSQGFPENKNEDSSHTFSHRAPVSTQARFQSQGFAEKKNQDSSHTFSHRTPVSTQARFQNQSFAERKNQDSSHILTHRALVNTQTHLQSQDLTEIKNKDPPDTFHHRVPENTQAHFQSQGFAEKKNQDSSHTFSHRAPVSTQARFQSQGFAEKKNQDSSHSFSHRTPVNTQACFQSQDLTEIENQDSSHTLSHRAPVSTQANFQIQSFAEKKNQDFSHNVSRSAPMKRQGHMQSQGHTDMKNQDHPHMLSHRAPVNTQTHLQGQGIAELKNQDNPPVFSRYQGAHPSSYQNKRTEKGTEGHQFQTQRVLPPSQQPQSNIKSDNAHQRSYNQQQSFPNQSRKQGSINRNDTSHLTSNAPKNQQNINPQRVPKVGRPQPELNMKSKPIPSLMSQQIPKKDYFDAKLIEKEEPKEIDEVDMSPQGQGIPAKAHTLGTKQVFPLNTNKEGKGGKLLSTSWDAEDFTSDDMTGIDDWESEESRPLSPRSKLQQNQSHGQTNVSQIVNPPGSIMHPSSIVTTRPVQHRTQQPHQGLQQTPQIASQLRPRVDQSTQIRPLVGKSTAPSMTARSVSQQQGGPLGEKGQTKPGINSAPQVESPAIVHEEVVKNKHGASAPGSQTVQLSQRPTGGNERKPRPSLNSNSGAHAQGMKQPKKGGDSVTSILADNERVPSLRHQYQVPSNVFNYKKTDCRHYPNCRFKAACHNKHPPCPDTIYCNNDACIYDHPQLTRQEINDIKVKLRGQKTEPAPSQASKFADGVAKQDKPSSEPHSNLPNSGESLQEGGEPDRYQSVVGSKKYLPNRDQDRLPHEDFDYHDDGDSDLANSTQEEMYRRDESYEDLYHRKFDVSGERTLPRFPPGARLGRGSRAPVSQSAQFGHQSKSSGTDGRYRDRAEVTLDGKGKNVAVQGKRETFAQEGGRDLKDTEKKGATEGIRNANRSVVDLDASQNVDYLGRKLSVERQAEVPSSVDTERLEGKRYLEGLHRGSDIYDSRIPEPDRGSYWNRYQAEEQHADDQYYSGENEWHRMHDQSGRYGDQVYQDKGIFGAGEDYDRRSAYHRTPSRDEWRRQPMRGEIGRPFARGDVERYPPGGDPPRFDERDFYSRDYPARAPFRDELNQFGELNRPASPPRRESFREQIEFEKRYRDWERQHFPIDDPTREWEYELRRRELLGASQAAADAAASAGYELTDPQRDYPPYEMDSYSRSSYDERYRSDSSYPRDSYLDRSRDVLRPAVFDYDHATKFGLYDVDPWKLPPADSPLDSTADAKRSPVHQSQSPKLSSVPSSGLSSRRDSHERSSADRRRLSPSRRSRSPQSSRSPRRGNSPRRDDPDRSSRSLPRKSRSPSRRSGSPSRNLPARRSSSPRKRRSSPLHDRHRSREDSRSRDRGDRKDRLPDLDRRRPQQDISYTERDRIPYDRRGSRELAEDPYYGRYSESRVTEILTVEPGPEILPIQDLLDSPGRSSRPKQIVIILRGPPGCGKTHIAKIIKDKEVTNKAPAPRILALDDYFIQETDVYEKDPDTGKRVKVKKMEYVYESDMEGAYRVSLLKSFNKTLDNGYFPMVIIDAINDKVEHFQKFWSDGKHKGFEVYIAEMHGEAQDCAEKNIHNWTQDKIQKMLDSWESTPNHFKQLDVRSLVQDAAIKEVEMEEVEQPVVEKPPEKEKLKEDDEDVDEEDLGTFHIPQKSKWEESKDEQLAKLDGISHNKKKRKATHDMFRNKDDDDYYDDDPYDEREEDMRIGKKRVRWADIEEKKELEHRKRIGFCIGTDWSVLTDPNAQVPL